MGSRCDKKRGIRLYFYCPPRYMGYDMGPFLKNGNLTLQSFSRCITRKKAFKKGEIPSFCSLPQENLAAVVLARLVVPLFFFFLQAAAITEKITIAFLFHFVAKPRSRAKCGSGVAHITSFGSPDNRKERKKNFPQFRISQGCQQKLSRRHKTFFWSITFAVSFVPLEGK